MMGIHQRQEELWTKAIDLGSRIPEDHILRQLEKVLDLGFVREEVADCYGERGNVSIDPVVLVRLMLLLFIDNVRSERELMRVLPLRIDYLWFLGYGLDDTIPNHSVLSKARKRWGVAIFEKLFGRVLEQCLKAGLVGLEKVHIDSSLVRANASLSSVVKTIVGEQMDKLDEQPAGDDQDIVKAPRHKPVNTKFRSTTDPDSRVVRHDGGKAKPCFKNHRVVDDKAGVTTAITTTHGVANDGNELMDLLDQHEQRTGQKPDTAVADCCYGDTDNLVALAQAGIQAHVGDLRSRLVNARSRGIFPADRFSYDAESDTFKCPAGEQLYRHHFVKRRGHWEFRTKRGTCDGCPLREQCTRDKSGRTLKRHEHQELLDAARAESHSEAAREDRKRRQWFQERNFGEAAVMHGFKRARWRGLGRQSIQDLLIAAIQNLKILARRHAWARLGLLAFGILRTSPCSMASEESPASLHNSGECL
jgi:transposase